MRRALVISLAAVLLVVGLAFGLYRAGWWPGRTVAAPADTFEQSRIDELREDVGTASTVSADMAAASGAAQEVLRHQGRDVAVQACTVAGEIHQLPPDLAEFVRHNCADGQLAPASPFADPTDGAAATPTADPDPGAN